MNPITTLGFYVPPEPKVGFDIATIRPAVVTEGLAVGLASGALLGAFVSKKHRPRNAALGAGAAYGAMALLYPPNSSPKVGASPAEVAAANSAPLGTFSSMAVGAIGAGVIFFLLFGDKDLRP